MKSDGLGVLLTYLLKDLTSYVTSQYVEADLNKKSCSGQRPPQDERLSYKGSKSP